MGNLNQPSKLLCTHCLNFQMHFVFCMIIWISLLRIFFEYGECKLIKISHYLQVFWISHFKGWLYLSNKEFTGTLPTEMRNMNQLSKLLYTHCLNSLQDFSFCMIICISLLWIYDLNMESVNWPKYLTTCKSCEFLISKSGWICHITN